MAAVFQRALKILTTLENAVFNSLRNRFPPECLAPALVDFPKVDTNIKTKSLSELLQDGILWAVPKKRRSVEKRRNRKFGWERYVYKMLKPKTNILICTKCGQYHEAGVLCPHCYQKIMKETEEIQEAIQAKLGISPVESEVVVLYSGEEANPEFYQGKRIIEMKKERPKIFSDNLLQRSTQGPADTKEVTPTNQVN